MGLSENNLVVRFRDYNSKASVDSVVPFDYNKGSGHNNSYINEKIIELFKWFNLRTCFFGKSFSIEQLKRDLMDSESTLCSFSGEENILSPINVLRLDQQDTLGTGDLVTPNSERDNQQQQK